MYITIPVKQVYWYISQVSGERLQDHWSSGLFNSFSKLLVGDESRSLELRYRCCVEMVTNRSKVMVHRLYSKLEVLSPDYDRDCLDCATPGKWSSVWMIIALSNLLNIPVQSVYPAVNGSSCK